MAGLTALLQKKSPAETRGMVVKMNQILKLNYIVSSRTFWAVDNVELHPGAFIKRFIPFRFNRREMHENIVAVILLDKTETLRRIKPFYCTF